jgi:hypothetical protein
MSALNEWLLSEKWIAHLSVGVWVSMITRDRAKEHQQISWRGAAPRQRKSIVAASEPLHFVISRGFHSLANEVGEVAYVFLELVFINTGFLCIRFELFDVLRDDGIARIVGLRVNVFGDPR